MRSRTPANEADGLLSRRQVVEVVRADLGGSTRQTKSVGEVAVIMVRCR